MATSGKGLHSPRVNHAEPSLGGKLVKKKVRKDKGDVKQSNPLKKKKIKKNLQ